MNPRYNYTFGHESEALFKRNKHKLEGRGAFISRAILKAFSRAGERNANKRSNSRPAQE